MKSAPETQTNLLTGRSVYKGCIPYILGENDREASGQVPVNMAVKQPRPWVVGLERESAGTREGHGIRDG